MASLHHLLIIAFSCFLLFNVSHSVSLTSHGLSLPVSRDEVTGFHRVVVMKRTPPLPLSFLLDINSPIMQRAPCELAQDVLSIPLSQGLHGQLATIEQYTFACASSRLIQPGYPKGIRGVVGFGPTPLSLPYQLASSLGHRRAFCLCLAASSQETGALFFGTVPTSIPLVGETKLIISRQSEYFIGVRSLSISGQSIQLPSLLGIQEGVVQTKISTTERYLILHNSILKVVTRSFVSQLQGVRQVQAIAPFGVCFDHESIRSRKVLPNIDLVLHGENAVWSLVGANLLVSPQPGVACLAAVDGGVRLQAPIGLGVHQLQNYLLHFDLEASTLRFSKSLLLGGRTCSGLVASNN
ncbi:hypothetical protein Ancab_000770 [Ancistrocladus abbreviatus]